MWYAFRLANLDTGEIREQHVSGDTMAHAAKRWFSRKLTQEMFIECNQQKLKLDILQVTSR